MKKSILVLVLTALGFSGYTQEDTTSNWKTGGAVNITFSQVSLTNWAAGGLNTVSLNGFVNLYANYKKGKTTWDNSLDVGYGVIKQGDQNWQKSDDRLEFNSKYGRQINKQWYYSALANFRTQFAPGFKLPNDSVIISDFMAPGYLLTSAGFDFKPNDNFSVFISPLTGKFTFAESGASGSR